MLRWFGFLLAALCAGQALAQVFPPYGGGGTYTAGSGLTLTGSTFSLGDASLTYSAGALSLGASVTTAGSLTIYNAASGFAAATAPPTPPAQIPLTPAQ